MRLGLIRMYAYARLEGEIRSITTWLCICWPLYLNGLLIVHLRTFCNCRVLAIGGNHVWPWVLLFFLLSFSFSWSNTSGSIWCSPNQRQWQTLVLIVFDTAFRSLLQSSDDETEKRNEKRKERIMHAFSEISLQQRSISFSPYQIVVRVCVYVCI